MRQALTLFTILMLSGCAWTSDHFSRPTNPADGKVFSPPRFVRILRWKRPDWFTGEFLRDGKWCRDDFVLVTRGAEPSEEAPAWVIPEWTNHWQPDPVELTDAERGQLDDIKKRYPEDANIEVEYPLMEKRYLDDIGHGTDVRIPGDGVSIYGGYLVSIRKRIRNAILIPAHER